MAWYQGDIETDGYGGGHERFLARFNDDVGIQFFNTSNFPDLRGPLLKVKP